MTKDKFLRGAMILTMAGLMVKVIGSVNRILLSRLLGGEGIGLYQMAYPVYLLLLALSSAGIPVAISIIVSKLVAKEDYVNVRRVFHISLRVMGLVGLTLAFCLMLAAHFLIADGIVKDARAYYALMALTPSIIFATMLASFRGFFQGHQLMTPPAVSQILEQFIRVMTMLVLAYALLPYGLEYAAAGAAFGAFPGSLTGLVVLTWFYRHYRHLWQRQNPPGVTTESFTAWQLMKRLLLLALPVSCANILVPVTSSIDALFVPKYLMESGLATREATTLYGFLSGMAQPLLLMATIPTMSLATSIVPAVSEAFTLGQRDVIREKAITAMKLCCLITFPASVGMSVLALPISSVLYGTAGAAEAVMHAGAAICLLGMQQVTTGILQGMQQAALPMCTMMAGLAVKLAVLGPLTREYGVAGAAWATNINFALTAVLNLVALWYYGIRFPWSGIAKNAVAAVLMGALCSWLYGAFAGAIGAIGAMVAVMALAAAFYAVLVLALGIVHKNELAKMPLIKKFIK